MNRNRILLRRLPGKSLSDSQAYQLISTQSGLRMIQHGTVLSEVKQNPGPSHSVVDVIAAVIQATASGPRVAMLGFAGGGVLAPLRALGEVHEVAAVDLDESGWGVFQRLCATWAGKVSFECADACALLRDNTRRYDVIVEDLSVAMDGEVVKPAATWSELPPLIYHRLKARGVAIFNLIHPSQGSWEHGIRGVLKNGFSARVVEFAEYENRLLIAAENLPPARKLGAQIRGHLKMIQSQLASRISVRTYDTGVRLTDQASQGTFTKRRHRGVFATHCRGPRASSA